MKSLQRATIGIIGAGNMGQALIRGLLAAGLSSKRLLVVEANPSMRRRVERRYYVELSTIERSAARCRILIMAVKPQDAKAVMAEVGRCLKVRRRPLPLMISIVAGLTVRTLEKSLGSCPVVRVMPNLAATVGCAMSVMTAGRWATLAHRAIATALFRSVGEVAELPERNFDAVTAISGSGPAYFFVIFKALRDAGMQHGIPARIAQQLAVQTALGSTKLVTGSTETLEALIARVASKKGTTEAALKVLTRKQLAAILQAGVLAATRRSQELSALLRTTPGK